MYSSMTGWSHAFSTVVEQRSNSRNSGLHLRRERDPEVRPGGADRVPEARLVLRVLEREEEAHRGGVRLDIAEALDRLRDRGVPEGADHPSARGDPLLHLEAPLARHEGRRLVAVEVVHVGPDLAPDLEEVTEAGRRDEDHLPAPALDDGVGRHRGPVREPPDLSERDPGLRELAEPLDDRPPGVVAGRGPLRDPDVTAPGAHREEVRERPPDVHPHDPAHAVQASPAICPMRLCRPPPSS